MTGRRHLARASYALLPPQTSLYAAMQSIIGRELRRCFEPRQDMGPELRSLLIMRLDDEQKERKPA